MLFLTFETEKDQAQFIYLYEKYNKLLYKIAFGILKNSSDVEDALQISWAKIANCLEKIKGITDGKELNFLIIITKNSAIDLFNRRKKDAISLEKAVNEEATSNFQKIYMGLDLYDFKKAISQLDDEYRQPLILKYTYGYSLKEIADILHISESNVGTKIYRAKNQIKKFILDEVKNSEE